MSTAKRRPGIFTNQGPSDHKGEIPADHEKLQETREDKSLATVMSQKRAKLESQLKDHYGGLKAIAPGLVGRGSLTPDVPRKDCILMPSDFTHTNERCLVSPTSSKRR